MAERCNTGGILWLRELIDEHPAEITADFRSRYSLSIEDAGVTYSYKEAIYLSYILLRDTTSWLFTAVNKWKYPASIEYLQALNLYDLTYAANSKKKAKPIARPFKTQQEVDSEYREGKFGSTKNVDQSKVRAFLEKLGHKPQGE